MKKAIKALFKESKRLSEQTHQRAKTEADKLRKNQSRLLNSVLDSITK